MQTTSFNGISIGFQLKSSKSQGLRNVQVTVQQVRLPAAQLIQKISFQYFHTLGFFINYHHKKQRTSLAKAKSFARPKEERHD